MLRLLKRILEAVMNQGENHKAPRYQRRMDARLSGRMTTNGRYFGGVALSKEKRIERFCAGKGDL